MRRIHLPSLTSSLFAPRTMRVAVFAVFLLAAGCDDTRAAPTAPANDDLLAHLAVAGDPAAAQGATFAYRDTVEGVAYELTGVLMKPAGAGPFPGVVVSHGLSGSAAGYGRSIGTHLVRWGMAVVAVNYTHAVGATLGSPGTQSELGASTANVRRARRAAAILAAFDWADTTRFAAHGHSMGAFVTTALAAAHPALLRAATHSAGGVRVDFLTGTAPSESEARAIRTPYQLHHGERDVVVSPAADQRLSSALAASGTPHELHVYAGVDHNGVAFDPVMLERMRAWYVRHGVLR